MQPDYRYTVASESELNQLLEGSEAGLAFQWSRWSSPQRLQSGETGVIWKKGNIPHDPVQPVALIAREEDFRRLCGRVAQLRGDLSPLTAWCHLLTPELLEFLQEPQNEPELGGLQAAWTGLIVAETALLADIPLGSIRISGCLATLSFAIARTHAVWNRISDGETVKRFDATNRLFRNVTTAHKAELRVTKVRSALQPIWACLSALSTPGSYSVFDELYSITASLRELHGTRLDQTNSHLSRSERDQEEARRLVDPLLPFVPEASPFKNLVDLAPERRLKLFDKLVEALNVSEDGSQSLRRNALALLAGYLATVAAGGAPSLALAEGISNKWPEVTAWAYVVGGLGEKVVWTSSFEGLGRLVARELMRPFRLDESPTCDFSLDEAVLLIDPKLRDPYVHLRIKQAKILSVAIQPGVNISVPMGESIASESPKHDAERSGRQSGATSANPMAVLADAVWPHLRGRIQAEFRALENEDDEWRESDSQRSKGKRKSSQQSQLPLPNARK